MILTVEKMRSISLLKQFLKIRVISKTKKIKKYFNKNIVLSEEDDKRFQSSNRCWICNKLLDVGDNKVRGHDHVTKNIEVLLI